MDMDIEKDGPEDTAKYTGQRYKDNDSDNSSSEVDDDDEEGEEEDVDGNEGGEGVKGGKKRQCVGDLVPSRDAMHLRTCSEPEHTRGSLKVRLLSVPSATLQNTGAGTGTGVGEERGGERGGRKGSGTGSGTGVGLTLHEDDSEGKYQYLQIATSELVHNLGKVSKL